MRMYAHRPASSDGSRNSSSGKSNSDISIPADVARKISSRFKSRSLFELRSDIREAFRFVNSKHPVEAQYIINELKAIAMGYK